MIPGLEPVALRDLRALGVPRLWEVDDYLSDLPSLTPVRGTIEAEHRGNVLAVQGSLSTIVTMICDRCLNQFNQQLISQTDELIWLGDDLPTEEQILGSGELDPMEGLVERLDPRGAFDPQQWAFEHLNLQMPVVNRCPGDCPGPCGLPRSRSDDTAPGSDPRWDALKQLQISQGDQP